MQLPDYKPALEAPPLSDDELVQLDDVLGELPTAFDIEMLDGYLTALQLAPQPAAQLKGADWLPPVWGEAAGANADEGAAPFASGKQKKQAVVMVLRHLRAIDQALHHAPEQWEPVFSVAETEDGQELADAEDWCVGFLHATVLDPEGWGALFDDPVLGPLLAPIGLLGSDEAGLSEADRLRLQDPVHRDALSRAVPDAALALARRAR